jgi:hypothetical protein
MVRGICDYGHPGQKTEKETTTKGGLNISTDVFVVLLH